MGLYSFVVFEMGGLQFSLSVFQSRHSMLHVSVLCCAFKPNLSSVLMQMVPACVTHCSLRKN